jgi:DNA polymerase III delta prime subunit
MNNININELLNRQEEKNKIKQILQNFEINKNDLSVKKGIYIYGDPGTGKTSFVIDILNELNYDIVKYDAGDIRNKSIIDTITKHNMSDKNIMSLFYKQRKQIAIVMDEIDGMNSGDKGGINSLIKLIRPKKTKKQRLEEITNNPIICIGNFHIDKKFKELMKVCHSIELKTPTKIQISSLINTLVPNMSLDLKTVVIQFIQGDLRKVNKIYEIYNMNPELLTINMIKNVFLKKSYNDNTRKITKKLLNDAVPIEEHLTMINETDRTSVGLLFHENIIDVISKTKKEVSVPFYLNILENICFSDYIDRITFQKQIWQFNEMSSLIKTFKNNKLYHETFKKKCKYNPTEVRFTKVLTKYSTEYNNIIFIQDFCQELNMDKKDLFAYFLDLSKNTDDNDLNEIFENYEITKLDINRLYRYIDKFIKYNDLEVIEIDDDVSLDNF